MLAAAPLRHADIAGRDLTVRFRAVVRLRADTPRLAGLRAASLRLVLVRRLATVRLTELRFFATFFFATLRLVAVRFFATFFFAAAFLAAIFLAFRIRALAFANALFLAASFLAAAFFAAMHFFTNRRAALIFFSAALTAFLAFVISPANILGVFGFEAFRLTFVVVILPILFFQKKQRR